MILFSQWLSLPLPTRHKIASQFNITKKGPTHVVDNVVKDDGYAIKDIESALTMDSLQKYLGTTEQNLTVLWNYLVDKIEGRNIVLVDTPIPPALHSTLNPLSRETYTPKLDEIPKVEPGKIPPHIKEILIKRRGRPSLKK